ncbi:MAG: hypothetical protein LW870_03975 [Pirellula sp.]|jgi:NRPS condensation-like uncharacterized protein|nr:hypothetical protein [Pirellula sp.]
MSRDWTEHSKLACTAFEELMLAQDNVAFPCVICLRMAFDGKLQRELFTQAIDWMVETNPLFRSRIVRGKLGRHFWEIQSKSDYPIHWEQTEREPNWPKTRTIDLKSTTGVVVEAMELADPVLKSIRTIIFVHIHHAVADGQGIMQAMHEMWLRYDALFHSNPLPNWERVPQKLSARNRFGLNLSKVAKMLPKLSVGLLGVRQYVMRTPKPLMDTLDPIKFKEAEPNIHAISFRLTKEESQRLRQAVQVCEKTVNDVVAGIVFEACLKLLQTQATFRDNDWLRMMVPISMRGSEEYRRQTACNIVSCVFLDRVPAQIKDRATLLQSVHDELELIKKNRLAFLFVFSIWLRKMFTLPWPNATGKVPSRCQTSVVFSNLGRVFSDGRAATRRFVAGDVTLENVAILAPLSPWMMATFVATQYVGEQQLTLRYDSRWISELQARSLVDHCQQQLQQFGERPQGAT